MYVALGAGHFLLGLFNADTLNEWRTPNTMAAESTDVVKWGSIVTPSIAPANGGQEPA